MEYDGGKYVERSELATIRVEGLLVVLYAYSSSSFLSTRGIPRPVFAYLPTKLKWSLWFFNESLVKANRPKSNPQGPLSFSFLSQTL